MHGGIVERQGVRRLPVLDAAGGLPGLVTLDNSLAVLAGPMQAVAAAIGSEQRRERQRRA